MANNSSAALDSVQRRCAALMTLSEVLDGETLMNALWMLEERDQTADKMTFIGFFGVTAELLGINSNVITTLYAKLNRNLNLSLHELPADPMPEMLKYRGVDHADQKTKQQGVAEKKADDSRPIKVKSKKSASAEMTVCVALIANITLAAGYPKAESFALFKEVFMEEINAAKMDREVTQQLFSWVEALSNKAFKRNFSEDQLGIIVHGVYVALCEALGPVKADDIMNHAVIKTSALSVAKLYSPKNFL